MQKSIGSQDINGAEIHEGNTVKITILDDQNKIIATELNIVIYETARAAFVFAKSRGHRGLSIDGFFSRYKDAKHLQFEVMDILQEEKQL